MCLKIFLIEFNKQKKLINLIKFKINLFALKKKKPIL